MQQESRAQSVVIGGGLHGLAAAWHLRRLGSEVVLLERFRVGHDRGSSHGPSRVYRSAYPSPVYVHLLRAAGREEWPRLERESGKKLVHPCDGCFLGPPGGLFEEFSRTMASFGEEVELLEPPRARRRFPQFNFEGMAGAIDDRTAGVIASAETISSLAELCARDGVVLHDETTVTGIEADSDPVRVRSSRGDFLADHVVVAAGSWTSEILPFLRPKLTVVRQNIGYFVLDGPEGAFGPEQFPVWAYLGAGANDFFYGLPEFGSRGVKAARHVTAEDSDDPNGSNAPSPDALVEVRALVERLFTAPVKEMVASDTCLYTNTATEDFIIDCHPANPRVVIGAGFSGHGFKFGPLTGRILAELALQGRTDVPEFNRHRDTFAFVL